MKVISMYRSLVFRVFALTAFASALATFSSTLLYSQETLPSLDVRFKTNADGNASTDEVPDFQKHISPLLGRLGCNGRACHGSFQGQGGLMLSLFGYDFDADHKALMDEKNPRINLTSPKESLILVKPTDAEQHEGGQRFKIGSWEYAVLRKWIEAGAVKRAPTVNEDQKLVALEVTPREISLREKGQKHQVRAVAVWQDGVREDVTALCRFFSNDTAIAQIDELGVITAGEQGDTHVVVAYDNAVVPIAVLRPYGLSGELQAQIANAKTEIDRLVLKKLDKLGVQPSERSTDAEFFRRVSLDLTGTLPTSAQVRAFLENNSPDKRSAAIETLLESPGYAAWWTTFFCDITGNNNDQLRNFTYLRDTPSQHWYQWIYHRIEKNVPYDQIVEGIVTAVSREPGESYREYCEAMTKIANDKSGKSFAERSDLMYYWARNNQRTAEERAISFAYAFCGVRIQCAQCHKHPFDQWTKKDFDQFERLFDGIVANQNSMMPDAKPEYEQMITELGLSTSTKGNQLAKEIQGKLDKGLIEKTIPFPEMFVKLNKPKEASKDKNKDKKGKKQPEAKAYPTARLLGGDFVDLSQVKDPREPLMDWLRKKDNPYFAKAIVNRIWAHYFQVGIVNPPDDLNLANAPSNAELLDYLANGFIESGYDLKWLHRTIVNTDTYQRSWRTNVSNVHDRRNFSHALLRRLPAETAYDALRIALSSDEVAQSMCSLEAERATTVAGASASSKGGGKKSDISTYALSVFGRSIRETNCDCDRTSDPSLLQTVFIRNDSDVLKAMTDPKRSWLAQVADERNWSLNKIVDKSLEKGKTEEMVDDSPEGQQKVVDDLDKKIRTYKAQLEKLTKKDGTEKAVKDIKSRLALAEKRLAEQQAKIALRLEQEKKSPEASVETTSVAANSVAKNADVVGLVEEAYLRTLSRKPTPAELDASHAAVATAESPIQGLNDLLWALINSKEFILNH